MTQADRDRLVTLKKAKKKLITQREAAEELGLSTRHVRRLLYAMKKRGGQGRGARVARHTVEPQDRSESGAGGGEDSVGRRCIKGSGRRWRRSTWLRSTGSR